MDILQELPLERWPDLQARLKSLWPQNLPGFYSLYTNLRYPEIRDAVKFKVYCPNGDMSYGFVGSLFKRAQAQDILLFSFNEDTTILEEAILKTKIINWNLRVCFILVNFLMIKSLERLKEAIGFTKYYHVLKTKMYVLDRSLKPFEDLSPPVNTYAGPVKPEHLHRVNELWPYKNALSLSNFITFATNGLSYGLYSLKHELLAWIFINESNHLCHWYCEEEYRGRGYGEFVLKVAVNDQLSLGNDVYGFVVEGNDKPSAIFRKLGFKAVEDVAFVYVEI